MLLITLFYLSFIVLYLIGGQYKKQFRRFGAPLSAILYTLKYDKQRSGKYKAKYIALALLVFLFSMGYGEDSKIHALCGKRDWLTRIVYGLILSIPFIIINGYLWFCYVVILPAVYSVRAGSLGKIGRYDILVEDIVRAVGLCICVQISLL
jgi:hypothetical protein